MLRPHEAISSNAAAAAVDREVEGLCEGSMPPLEMIGTSTLAFRADAGAAYYR